MENIKVTLEWKEQKDRMFDKLTKWRMSASNNPGTKNRKLSLINELEKLVISYSNSEPSEIMKPCVVDYYDYYYGKKPNTKEGVSNISSESELTPSQIQKIKDFKWPLK